MNEGALETFLRGVVGAQGAAALVFVDATGAVHYMSVMKCDKGGIARLAQGLVRAGGEVYTRHGFPVKVRTERVK